jgi:hypothetical protein
MKPNACKSRDEVCIKSLGTNHAHVIIPFPPSQRTRISCTSHVRRVPLAHPYTRFPSPIHTPRSCQTLTSHTRTETRSPPRTHARNPRPRMLARFLTLSLSLSLSHRPDFTTVLAGESHAFLVLSFDSALDGYTVARRDTAPDAGRRSFGFLVAEF